MDFETMKRKDLQALCKKHAIPANFSNREMARRLVLLFQEDDKSNHNVKKVKFSPENETFTFDDSDSESESGRTKRLRNRNSSRNTVMEKKKSEKVGEFSKEIPDTRSREKRVSVPEQESEPVSKGRKIVKEKKTLEEVGEIAEEVGAKRVYVPEEESEPVRFLRRGRKIVMEKKTLEEVGENRVSVPEEESEEVRLLHRGRKIVKEKKTLEEVGEIAKEVGENRVSVSEEESEPVRLLRRGRKIVTEKKTLEEVKEITEKVPATRSRAKRVSVPEDESELVQLPHKGRKVVMEKKTIEEVKEITEKVPATWSRAKRVPVPEDESELVQLPRRGRKIVMEKKTLEEVVEIPEKVSPTRYRAKCVSAPEQESEPVQFPRRGRKIVMEKKTLEEVVEIREKVPSTRSRARSVPVPEEEIEPVYWPVSVRGFKRLREIVDASDAGEIFADTAEENIHRNPKRKSTKDKGLGVGRVTGAQTWGSAVEIEHGKSLEGVVKKTTAVAKKSKNRTKRQVPKEVPNAKLSGDSTKGPRRTRSVTSLRSPDAFIVTANEGTSETMNQERYFNGDIPGQYDRVACNIGGSEFKEQRQSSVNECSKIGSSKRNDVELTLGETNVSTEESSPVNDTKFAALDNEEMSCEYKKEPRRESAATGLLDTTLILEVDSAAADTTLEGEAPTKCEDLSVVEPARDILEGKENFTIGEVKNCNALNENEEMAMEDSLCKMHTDVEKVSDNPTPRSLSSEGDHSNLLHSEETLETKESVMGNNRCPEIREVSDQSSEDGRANNADENLESDETEVQEVTASNNETCLNVECLQAHEVDQTEDIIVTIEQKSEEAVDIGSPSADNAADSGIGYASCVDGDFEELRQEPATNKQGSGNVLQEPSCNDFSKFGTPKRNNIEEAPVCDVGFPASDNKIMSCDYKKECRKRSRAISLLQSTMIRSAVKSEVSIKDEEIYVAEPMEELNVELSVKEKEKCTTEEVRNCNYLYENAENVVEDSSCKLVSGEELCDYQLVQQAQDQKMHSDPENIYENPTTKRHSPTGLSIIKERLEAEESVVDEKKRLGSYEVSDESSEEDRATNADAKFNSNAIDVYDGITFNREGDIIEELVEKHDVEKIEDITVRSEQKFDEAPKHVSPSVDASVVDVLGKVDDDSMVSTQHESVATCTERVDFETKSLLIHISSPSGYEQECNPDFSEALFVEHEEEVEDEAYLNDDMLVQPAQNPKRHSDSENVYENQTPRRINLKGERSGLLNVERPAVNNKKCLGTNEVSNDRVNNADANLDSDAIDVFNQESHVCEELILEHYAEKSEEDITATSEQKSDEAPKHVSSSVDASAVDVMGNVEDDTMVSTQRESGATCAKKVNSETKSLLLHVSPPSGNELGSQDADEVNQESNVTMPDFSEALFVEHEEEAQEEAFTNYDSLTPNQSLCQHLQPVEVVAHLSFHSETIQNIDCFVSSCPAERGSDLHAHSVMVTAMELNESSRSDKGNMTWAREESVEANTRCEYVEGEKFVEENAVMSDDRNSELYVHSVEVTALELNESLRSNEENVTYACEEFVEANTGCEYDEGEKFVEENAVMTEESYPAFESQSGHGHQVSEPLFYNVFSHCGEENEESLKTSTERTKAESAVMEVSKSSDPGSTTSTDTLSVDRENAENQKVIRETVTQSNEVKLEDLERNLVESTVLEGSTPLALDNYECSNWDAENCNGNVSSVGVDSRSEALEFPVIHHDDDEVGDEITVTRIGLGDSATKFLGEPETSPPVSCTNRHVTSDGSSFGKEVLNQEDTQFNQPSEFEEFTEAANIEETISGTSAKCIPYDENEVKLAESSGLALADVTHFALTVETSKTGLEDDGNFGLENAGESAPEPGTDPKQTEADVELAAMDKNVSNTGLEDVDSASDVPVVADGRTSEHSNPRTTNEEADFEAFVAEDPETRHVKSMEANLLDGSTRKKARDGKENPQKEQFGSITASRQSAKRRPLGDLQIN